MFVLKVKKIFSNINKYFVYNKAIVLLIMKSMKHEDMDLQWENAQILNSDNIRETYISADVQVYNLIRINHFTLETLLSCLSV